MSALVSIIMPAHNMADFIGEAIRSVLAQTYSNWELIIVDNASIDKTSQIVLSFDDPRILLHCESIKGVSRARNKALDNAKGEFICFLDADDRLPPNSLRDRVQFLELNPVISFCDGVVKTFDKNFSIELSIFKPAIKGNVETDLLKLQPHCFAGITWMLRRNAVRDFRFPIDWNIMEDKLYFLQAAAIGNYDFVTSDIYHIRKRNDSSMRNIDSLDNAYKRYITEILVDRMTQSELRAEQKKYHSTFFKTYLRSGSIWKASLHAVKYISK